MNVIGMKSKKWKKYSVMSNERIDDQSEMKLTL